MMWPMLDKEACSFHPHLEPALAVRLMNMPQGFWFRQTVGI
jgi:hypothetical protein